MCVEIVCVWTDSSSLHFSYATTFEHERACLHIVRADESKQSQTLVIRSYLACGAWVLTEADDEHKWRCGSR